MKTTVSRLRPGSRFLWKQERPASWAASKTTFWNIAVVHDIVAMPEHILSATHGMMYSVDVEVTGTFSGAVQVLGTTEVEEVEW